MSLARLLDRAATALEGVPDPGIAELALIADLRAQQDVEHEREQRDTALGFSQHLDEGEIDMPAMKRSWGGMNCETCEGVCMSIRFPGQGCRGPVGATGVSFK